MSPPAHPFHGLTSIIFLIIFSLVTGAQTALLAYLLTGWLITEGGELGGRRESWEHNRWLQCFVVCLGGQSRAGFLQEASKDDRLHFLSEPHATLSVVLSLPSPTVSLLSRMLMGKTRCAVELDSSLGTFWGRVWHGHLVQPTLPILCLTPREWVWMGGSVT